MLTPDKPCAWALDGYPIYGYVEPDGSAQQALDADGGHDHGTWGYHYHARGSAATGPQSPYLMNAMHGTVVNYGGQIDPQPTASTVAPAGAPLAGAVITGFTRTGTDAWTMTYTHSGTTYTVTAAVNRIAHTVTVSQQSPTNPTGTPATYTSASRFNYYPMAPWSMAKLPDTGQTLSATATFGEDSDYTINAPSFTDNANGTVTDNVTGLMWQKTDSGEMIWDNARTGATTLNLAGFTDWRLPTAQEAFSILNHERNPALDPTYFVNNAGGTPGYFWTSDLFYGDNTKVWATNTGGGLGPHPKTSTISAGGAQRFHARYVRGTKPTTGHNYTNNNDGTVTDLDAGLMWTQVPSSAQNWNSALTYAEGLTTGGFNDWRLPNVKELQSLQDIPRATASGVTTAPCLNRVLFPAATATAYWSSTSVKSGTPTQAWLVDFGVTTTSTPSRNQQGIVSYEPYASTYPVFSVRTTSVTTQIVVEQPSGSGLTDGASTVGYGNVNVGGTSTKTFTIRNTGSTSLSITGVTIDGANAANFMVTASPASPIAAGASTTMDVRFGAGTVGSKVAALHIASSDTSVGTAFDVNLTGTGFIPPPTITSVATVPTVPSNTDTPILNATVTPASGATISTVKLSYNTGAQTTSTVFTETMSNTATTGTGGWDQTASPAVYPWTLVFTGGAGNIKQTTAANHTAAGQGGACGLEFGKGSATNSPPTSATTANAINATGTWVSGSTTTNYVEFYVATSNVGSGQGWSFLLAPDGTNFGTARISETTGSVHGFTKYHYDLQSTDLLSTLKMQFQFFGNNVGGAGSSKVQIDDITVVTTSGAPPVTLDMTGPANGGLYTVQIPAPQIAGATVNYTITATDSNGSITTSTGSYTTGPAPAITTASLPGGVLSGAYSQTLVASGGSGSGYTWSVISGALPPNFTLTSAGMLSGSTTTAGTYNFTVRVADSAGRISTKALSITISTTTAPNVVIILTDDQGWADVGYHTVAGQVPVQTPNMDALGASGIRLEKFYATTVCSVTRGSLLTGRNSLRTSVGNQKGLGLTEHLMPQTFKAAGYQTFMCGKWHMGGWDNNIYTTTMNGATIEVQHEGAEYLPHNRGWDFHKGQYGGAINYFTHTTADPGKNNAVDWWQNGVQLLNDNTDLQGHGGYSTDLLADKAVEQIVNREKTKPMLLYLAFNAIHAGVSAPQSYLDKYTALGVTGNRRTICAAVDCMDVAMGRVLAALDSEGITNNTLVVFMSDNGGDTTTGSLNSPLRGTKSDSYDGGLHTPAAIRWPGQLAAGVTSNQYVWVGDIFPTVCAAVGVTPLNTKPFDGVNLWPQLQSITAGSPNGGPRGVPLVTGDNGGPVALNLFTDPVNGGTKMFKLIRNPGTTVVNELFNLTNDPFETTDILLGANAAAHSSIVTTLTSAITGIVTESYPPYIGISGITQTAAAGGNITLYAPFSAYKNAPTVQWKKGGVNITSSSPFYQVTNSTGGNVAGVYMATLALTSVTPADAANYTVTVTNSNGTVTSPAGTLTVNTTPQQSWWFTNFGILAPTASGNAAVLADPENDGLSNLAEWAFGLSPALSDGTGITLSGAAITKRGIPRLGTDGVNYYAMFGRRKDHVAAGLTYTVQFSADLNAWENSAAIPTVIASDSEMDAASVPFPALLGSGAKPKFFRLRVSGP